MSKPKTNPDPFTSIDDEDLSNVAGGAARVTARTSAANDQLMMLMTQIGNSIKDLATKQGGSDPGQMMMMMMMMGGMGGGGAAAAPAPAPMPEPAPTAPPINITVSNKR
ncbi:MAG: hypothetical protein AB7P03_20080 [Kofleriaceae bacterium]